MLLSFRSYLWTEIIMYTDVYKIADHVIKVSSMHQEVRKLCRDYLCEEKAEYEIVISQTDIEYERKKVQNDKKRN